MIRRRNLALFTASSLFGCAAGTSGDADESWLDAPLVNDSAMTALTPCNLGTEILTPNDGWAAEGAGTSGGSLATPDQVYVVTSRSQFIAALNDGVAATVSPLNPSAAPKIIYVDGTIDFNVDDDNLPLTCAAYYRSGYTPQAFLQAYDRRGVCAVSGSTFAALLLPT